MREAMDVKSEFVPRDRVPFYSDEMKAELARLHVVKIQLRQATRHFEMIVRHRDALMHEYRGLTAILHLVPRDRYDVYSVRIDELPDLVAQAEADMDSALTVVDEMKAQFDSDFAAEIKVRGGF